MLSISRSVDFETTHLQGEGGGWFDFVPSKSRLAGMIPVHAGSTAMCEHVGAIGEIGRSPDERGAS